MLSFKQFVEVPKEFTDHFYTRTKNHIRLVQDAGKFLHDSNMFELPITFLDRLRAHDQDKFWSDRYSGYIWINAHYNLKVEYPDKEIEDLAEKAWEDHYKYSDHHPEHFLDVNEMNIDQVAEMVSDWTAMALEKKEDFFFWWRNKASKKYKFDESHVLLIEKMLECLNGMKE